MKGTANRYTIALLSVIMVCLLAVPAMAQEEIVWQHGAVMPWDAERLASGNTLIAETGNNTVIEINTTTKELVWQYGIAGTPGSDPGQLDSPVDAERLLSGNTLITDRNNHRVIEVNTAGAIVWQYGTTGTSGSGYDQLNNPMDAERLLSGNTLIADRLNDRVIEVNESKGIVWQYGITNPFDADRLPDGNTLIAEYTNHRVIEINESDEIVWQYGDGTSGSGVNQLWYPMDADRLANGNTLIADHTNDRVIEVRTSDYDPAGTDNGFTAASIVWEYESNNPADADRLSGGSTLISEAGNHRVIEVVIGDVDIIPIAIETAPPTLYAGLTLCEVTATMSNNGSDHSGGFNASLYADGIEVDTKVVDDIPAGDSRNVTLEWIPTQAGDHNLTVVADSDNAIVETDEGNNELTVEVTVLPATVKRLTFDSGSSANPSIAADSKGNQHVVWSDNSYEGTGLYYKKIAPDGTVLVDDKGVCLGSGARIAIDHNDNLRVVFNNATNPLHVSYIKLDNNGNMLIEPKQVISAVLYAHVMIGDVWLPAKPYGIAVDSNGNAHVVGFWGPPGKTSYYGAQGIVYVKIDDQGSELVNHTLEWVQYSRSISTWDCMNAPSGIAVDSDGNAYTTYSKGLGDCKGSGCDGFACSNWPVCAKAWYVKIDGDGVHKQDLTGDLPLPSLHPSVCADSGGNKHVIWSQHNGSGSYDFYYTKFDTSDTKVIDGKRITYENYSGAISPIIDTESGAIHVAWSRESNIHYMGFDTSGGTLINRTLVSLEDGSSWEPDIDACPDGSHLVWTDNRDGNNEIYYTKTMAPPNRVFVLAPADQWTPQDIVATYTIGILSTMPNTETFNLALDNPDRADIELSNLTITLDPYSVGEVTLNVTASRVGDYLVTVTAASRTNPEIHGSATITTSVIEPTSDLIVTAMDAYHNDTGYPPYFNLSNEVDVTMKNVGTADAGTFDVCLYADDTLVDTQSVSGLGYGSYTTVQFKWTPVGMDCEDGGSPQTYTLKAIADCGDVITESDETNNELTADETAYWAGYSADEELVEASHGTIRGGLLYTTGDGSYVGLYNHGDSKDTHYEITLPESASVRHARLNVYYTWSRTMAYPLMEVSITNDATGESHTFTSPAASYNDRPCPSPAIGFEYPWGNYVYDLTPYIQGSGSYTARVTNSGTSDNQSSFCPSAPGLVIVYEESSMPEYEYWILEGADVVEGGRRGGAGYLSLEECTNDAVFQRSIDINNVSSATLGMVSIWGGEAWGEWSSHYWFNDNYLGDGRILDGYFELYDKTVDGMSMFVGASGNAQVGANVSDVTDYIVGNDNIVTFGDNGDSMMPSNAFLLVEYDEPCKEVKPEPAVLVPFMISGSVKDVNGNEKDNPGVAITNMNTGDVFTIEPSIYGYYQVLTSLEKVSCGDVLQFTWCDGISVEHKVRQREIESGGFEQDITLVTKPEADFSGTPTSGAKPLTVNFTDASISCDGIVAWEWDFGDGNTSADKNPTHVYVEEGNYTVTLKVYEADGDNNTETKVDYITVTSAIPAGVTLSPKKIDLNSSGVLKAYITLPEGYDVANISVNTVECEGAPVFGFGKVIPGKQALEVKFKIHNLTVPTGPEVLLTVTGNLFDGTAFKGSNTLKVV